MPSHGPSTPPPIHLKGPVPRFVTSLPHPRVVAQHCFYTPIETIRQLKPVFLAHRRQPAIPPQVSPERTPTHIGSKPSRYAAYSSLLVPPASFSNGISLNTQFPLVFHPYSHLHRNPVCNDSSLPNRPSTSPLPHPKHKFLKQNGSVPPVHSRAVFDHFKTHASASASTTTV